MQPLAGRGFGTPAERSLTSLIGIAFRAAGWRLRPTARRAPSGAGTGHVERPGASKRLQDASATGPKACPRPREARGLGQEGSGRGRDASSTRRNASTIFLEPSTTGQEASVTGRKSSAMAQIMKTATRITACHALPSPQGWTASLPRKYSRVSSSVQYT